MSDEEISFDAWLQGPLTPNDGVYRHRRLDEEVALRSEILPQLKQIVYEAHEDARRRLRRIEGVSLDPLEIPAGQDPAEGYPERLHMITLMGYFGEIFAGIICEEFAPLGESRWRVPAYLFRNHLAEFRHLDILYQVGVNENPDKEKRFGCTGDDCLAFVLDENDNIVRSLVCEAKCVQKHRTRKKNDEKTDEVADAHEKLGDKVISTLDRQQLIEVLMDSENSEAPRWIAALRKLRYEDQRVPEYERCDLVCCVYGTRRRAQETWIPVKWPHAKYKGGRRLEAVEVYIHEIRQLVRKVYGKDGDESEGQKRS
jgi:hypothetical protein